MWSQDPVLAWPAGSGLESMRCVADHAPVFSGGKGLLFYTFYSVTILIVQKICKDSTENSHVSFNQSHQFKTFFCILIFFLSSFLCLPPDTHTHAHTCTHTHFIFFSNHLEVVAAYVVLSVIPKNNNVLLHNHSAVIRFRKQHLYNPFYSLHSVYIIKSIVSTLCQ